MNRNISDGDNSRMDEETAFEARAVLAPRRARRTRLAVLLPIVALAGIALAGLSGSRPNAITAGAATAEQPGLTLSAPSPDVVAPPYPAQVLGLDVRPLGDVQLARLTRDDVVAIAGWYVPLAITGCPAVVAGYQGGSPAGIRPGFDPWAYCERSGVLYAARPGRGERGPAPGESEAAADLGPSAVDASLVAGVRLPAQLEQVGATPMPVVILGHFVESSSGCMLLGACPSELIVDYLGWAPGF